MLLPPAHCNRRFTARLDPSTGLYLALTNPSIDRYGANADARGILALAFSRDLLSWRVAATLLRPNDGLPWEESLWRTAYQYAGAFRTAGQTSLCCTSPTPLTVSCGWGGPAEGWGRLRMRQRCTPQEACRSTYGQVPRFASRGLPRRS